MRRPFDVLAEGPDGDKSGVKEAQVELFRQAVAELDTHIQQLITDSMMTP